MNKVFRDQLTELQIEIIAICLEYADRRADKIFIYCFCDGRYLASDYFYQIGNSIVERHELNNAISENEKQYDVSIERQIATINIINEKIEKIHKLYESYGEKMPTEIKFIYDVKNYNINTENKYDLVYFDKGKDPDDTAMKWYQEIKAKHNKQYRNY